MGEFCYKELILRGQFSMAEQPKVVIKLPIFEWHLLAQNRENTAQFEFELNPRPRLALETDGKVVC